MITCNSVITFTKSKRLADGQDFLYYEDNKLRWANACKCVKCEAVFPINSVVVSSNIISIRKFPLFNGNLCWSIDPDTGLCENCG